MDADLVGYGSSSDDESKAKNVDVSLQNVSYPPSMMNFRKNLYPDQKPSNPVSHESYESQSTIFRDTSQTNHSEAKSLVQSSSPYLGTSKSSEQNLDDKKRRTKSLSPSSDKESRCNVDEFGRQITHQPPKSKDEDRSGEKNVSPRRRSRSKSRERGRGSRNDDRGNERKQGRNKDRSRSPKKSDRRDRSPRRKDRSPRNRSPRRDRSPRRSGDRSPRRGGGHRSPPRRGRSPRRRSPRRSPIRDRRGSREFVDARKKPLYLGGPEKPIPALKEKETMSSEDVMKMLAQRAESMKHEAQAKAATHNLPSYLNPSVVNPQLYAKQQERRKLLWSSKKKEEAPTNNSMWTGTKFTGDQGGEMGAKFRRLMGIKGSEGASQTETEEGPSKGQEILTELEKEFERSRAFQLSRGAGGKSGIGLGYAPSGYQ